MMGYTFEQYLESAEALRQKLGAAGDYIETVRGMGYKIGDEK